MEISERSVTFVDLQAQASPTEEDSNFQLEKAKDPQPPSLIIIKMKQYYFYKVGLVSFLGKKITQLRRCISDL